MVTDFGAKFMPQQPKRSLDVLSPREREVMEAICEGLQGKEISFRLKLSEASVKVYSFTIRKKLRITGGNPELIASFWRTNRFCSARHYQFGDGFSRREWHVIHQIARGSPNKQIAATLRIKEPTVKSIIGRIQIKMETEMRLRDLSLICERLSGCLAS